MAHLHDTNHNISKRVLPTFVLAHSAVNIKANSMRRFQRCFGVFDRRGSGHSTMSPCTLNASDQHLRAQLFAPLCVTKQNTVANLANLDQPLRWGNEITFSSWFWTCQTTFVKVRLNILGLAEARIAFLYVLILTFPYISIKANTKIWTVDSCVFT